MMVENVFRRRSCRTSSRHPATEGLESQLVIMPNLQDRAEILRLLCRADGQMTTAATAQKLKKRSPALKDNSRQRPSKPCNYLPASSGSSWDSSPQMTM